MRPEYDRTQRLSNVFGNKLLLGARCLIYLSNIQFLNIILNKIWLVWEFGNFELLCMSPVRCVMNFQNTFLF